MAIQSRKMPPWEFCLYAKTRCNAGWLVSKGGGFAPPLAIVERLGGGLGGWRRAHQTLYRLWNWRGRIGNSPKKASNRRGWDLVLDQEPSHHIETLLVSCLSLATRPCILNTAQFCTMANPYNEGTKYLLHGNGGFECNVILLVHRCP